jgi:competence protein ComEA
MTSSRPNEYELNRIRQRGLLALAFLILAFLGFQYRQRVSVPPRENRSNLSAQRITIEISGSVNRPGLYTYSHPPTVEQVIRDAEGLKSDQRLLAMRSVITIVRDSTLTIKSAGHGILGLEERPLSEKSSWILGRPVSINRANEEDLDLIPGIGPGLARRIVSCRQRKGGFTSIEEMMEVDGIKEKTLEKIKGYLTL